MAAGLLAGLCIAGLPYRAAIAGSEPDTVQLRRADATISVSFRGPAPDVGRQALLGWVERSAGIVAGYYGQFPVGQVAVRITTLEGDRMLNGHTFGYPQARIEVSLGRHATAQALESDWILVHEMIHLSLPDLDDDHNWLAEGIPTYVEGIARLRAGNLTASELWAEYRADMPKGLPRDGDQGLDRTHTWARTYWGGALYCLLADVGIRTATGNRRGLEDALRAIRAAGAGMREPWPVERLIATGDAATGTTVLADLYARMKDRPYAPDLTVLWTDLGIVGDGAQVTFDERARLADVRRAISGAPGSATAR